MEWAEEKRPFDEVVEDKGVKIMIDAKAVLFLLGTEMDFEATPLKCLGSPEMVANTIKFVIENEFMTAETVFVSGGE